MGIFLLCVGMVVFMVAIMLMFKPESHKRQENNKKSAYRKPSLATRQVDRVPVVSPSFTQSKERLSEQKLLGVLHDPARIERLVAAKAKKMGRASRQELLEAVYDDYLRDRR